MSLKTAVLEGGHKPGSRNTLSFSSKRCEGNHKNINGRLQFNLSTDDEEISTVGLEMLMRFWLIQISGTARRPEIIGSIYCTNMIILKTKMNCYVCAHLLLFMYTSILVITHNGVCLEVDSTKQNSCPVTGLALVRGNQ